MPTPITKCTVCHQQIDVPGYGCARPLDADGGPHVCPPPELPVCNEAWFISQGLAAPPPAVSEPLTAEGYPEAVDGRWSQASKRTGKGGIAL